MSTERLTGEIQTLERKLKLLISEHSKLKQDIKLYRAENEELKSKLFEKDNRISDFQNKLKISKIVDNMVEEGAEKTELKDLIDNYIREIDKCIAHLGEA